uniref:holin n=1 Tax=Microbispora cellulosiformans TaxID=2614688 RepID=UPI001783A4E3|nr:holin [Microbispora cellulosiformans]
MDQPDHVGRHRRPPAAPAAPARGGWLLSRAWWADAAERAVRAAAGGALGVLAGKQTQVLPAADWRLAAQAGLAFGVGSLLVSIAAGGTGDKTSAAFLGRPDPPT